MSIQVTMPALGESVTEGTVTRWLKNVGDAVARDAILARLGTNTDLGAVADATVDTILSNCVINLSPDKAQVFSEAFRVLKPGGRLAISDMVGLQPFPKELPKDWELYTCCITGAALKSDLEHILAHCGFRDIRVEPKPGSREVIEQWVPGRGLEAGSATAHRNTPFLRRRGARGDDDAGQREHGQP